ncbi:hypothetical protein HOLleu_31867 [Holothuria leucospilota]|uniref:Uncharacterized protein n=1 Tax=Holothuria leucospilota TaxID=206669 RepID=A0A9Q0YQU8_HOLLE|nr:hypothetical protein HOLleu_31867 [Holothuria leucospilota]
MAVLHMGIERGETGARGLKPGSQNAENLGRPCQLTLARCGQKLFRGAWPAP